MRFSFVDATNLAGPDAGHVSGVELRFRSDRELTLIFTFSGAGRQSYERIELTRVQGAEPSPG